MALAKPSANSTVSISRCEFAKINLSKILNQLLDLLGHTQPSTTARYAHLDADPLRRASDNIGNRLAAAMGDLKPKTGIGSGAVAMQRTPEQRKRAR
jgi:hypothetical protein